MSDLKLTDDTFLTSAGIQVYQNNSFLGTLAEFMEHPLSREFYDKYMTHERLDTTLFFLWLYRQIEKEEPSLLPHKKLAILHHILHTSELRHAAFDLYHNRPSLRSTATPKQIKNQKT